ncbi:MAG: SUMF1/EgtB/PvdO family nonheme iron enzyme [Crocosphaera sp.]|nr:SUMF1/EgtB/PvdO family nonheme iron enzyme [Crocosphaera sp.]
MTKNWAICVGINRYDFHRILECAVNDATAMSQFFQDANFDKVYLFTDTSEPISDMKNNFPSQPTHGKFYSWLGYKFKKDKPPLKLSDNLWFFFSGHGWRYRGQDYLLFSDSSSDPEGFERTAIPIREITNYLYRSGAGNIIMFLDACRDSSAKSSSFELPKERGIIKISSCQPNQLSYEIKPLKHGAFTFALLESLRLQGEGNCATLERLCNRLRTRVKEVAWEYQQKIQVPYASVEPETKYHLLLLPDYIIPNNSDLALLKADAFKAEFVENDLRLAETIWTRLVRFDLDEALESLLRIRQKLTQQSSKPSTTKEITSEVKDSKSIAEEVQASISESNPIDSSLDLTEKPVSIDLEIDTFEVVTIEEDEQEEVNKNEANSLEKNKTQAKYHRFNYTVATIEKNKNLISKFLSNQEKWVINKQEKYTQGIIEELGEGLVLELVNIPGGTFFMGTDEEEIERLSDKFNNTWYKNESPQHQVTLQPFSMGRYPITQGQWKAIASDTSLKIERDLDPDPSRFKDAYQGQERWTRPVEQVSWYDAIEFCARLSKKTGKIYRLPTEAEWEYACRSQKEQHYKPFHFGDTITGDLANYRATSTYEDEPQGEYRQQTTPVGFFQVANEFGLYDMHGNVWEWCLDPWHGNYNGAPEDGRVWDENHQQEDYEQHIVKNIKNLLTNNQRRVLRGGSWDNRPVVCRCANRYDYLPDARYINIGFRVVCLP